MSELKWNWVYYPYLDAPNKQEESALKAGYIKVVIKDEADKVVEEKDKEIAELKKKLMPCLNGDCILTCEVVEKYGKENAELKQKLEDVQASAYAESVDAGMRERRLKEERRWRKFPEEKPKWGEEVLVVDDESKQYIVRFSYDMKWISWGKMNTCESNCVLYWMPLPEKPKDDKFKEAK